MFVHCGVVASQMCFLQLLTLEVDFIQLPQLISGGHVTNELFVPQLPTQISLIVAMYQ